MENIKSNFNVGRWVQLCIFNFGIVALAGVVLRYKINFPLPFINQKHLLHGHSYFAFVGWVTIALMALMIRYLQIQGADARYKIYRSLLWLNLFSAYIMLISFVLQGYGSISVSSSFFSIIISYFFIYFYWKDLNRVRENSHASLWFKGAMILWAISSLGAIALAILMTNKIMVVDYYFAAIYFFLHFQYNGWFLFACFGFLFAALNRHNFTSTLTVSRKLFSVMALTVIPAYILSVIWLKLPPVLIWTGYISDIFQLLVLIYFIRLFPIIKNGNFKRFSPVTRMLWLMAAVAFAIKICLQLFSIIPFFSQYAFTYRPIIIGYLHLSFLGVISFFLLGYMDVVLREDNRCFSKAGIFIFVTGVLAQELVLMLQGMEALSLSRVKWANMGLFYCALIIFSGLILTGVSTYPKQRLQD